MYALFTFCATGKIAGGGVEYDIMGRIQFLNTFQYIISVENLLDAWQEFLRGKRARTDVQFFELHLMANILALHRDLVGKTYKHSPYHAFNISDPKPRNIHKTSVRDRLLHHAVYRALYPFFDRTIIADSYSCRVNKGTHKALNQFRKYACQVSRNHTRTCWVLKCDIRKFFASIDHSVLSEIVNRYIPDPDIQWLLAQIISSFSSIEHGKGLPLGNLTSQLLVNVYMNEFDQYVKHGLKARHYIRYADDFVYFSSDKARLESILSFIRNFLSDRLHLDLHPDKVSIETVASGVDFLGWVHFPDHRILRTVARRRMFKNIKAKQVAEATVQSYLGLLRHGNTKKLAQQVRDATGKDESGI